MVGNPSVGSKEVGPEVESEGQEGLDISNAGKCRASKDKYFRFSHNVGLEGK